MQKELLNIYTLVDTDKSGKIDYSGYFLYK
jgi:hypothetical protein